MVDNGLRAVLALTSWGLDLSPRFMRARYYGRAQDWFKFCSEQRLTGYCPQYAVPPSLKSLLLAPMEAVVVAVAPVLGVVRQFDHGRITLQKAAEAIEGSEGRKGPLKSFL